MSVSESSTSRPSSERPSRSPTIRPGRRASAPNRSRTPSMVRCSCRIRSDSKLSRSSNSANCRPSSRSTRFDSPTPMSRAPVLRRPRRSPSRSRATGNRVESSSTGSGKVWLRDRVVKSPSRSFTVRVRAWKPSDRSWRATPTVSLSIRRSSSSSSSMSSEKVRSAEMDFRASPGFTSSEPIPRARRRSHSARRSPNQRTSHSRSTPSTSGTRDSPCARSSAASAGPTPGMSARSCSARKSASDPGATTWTPFGLARRVASFATSRLVPPPIETRMSLRAWTVRRMRSAVSVSDSPRKRRSVPVTSR